MAPTRRSTMVAKASLISFSFAGVQNEDLLSEGPGRCLQVFYLAHGDRAGRIYDIGDQAGVGCQLAEKVQAFRPQLGGETVHAGGIAARTGEAGDQTEPDWVFSDAKDDGDRRGR